MKDDLASINKLPDERKKQKEELSRKISISEALEDLGKIVDNVLIYRVLKRLSRIFEIDFPNNLSRRYCINKEIAEELKNEIEKNHDIYCRGVNIPFSVIYKVDAMKNKTIEDIALETKKGEKIIEEIINGLGYLPYWRRKNGANNSEDIEKEIYKMKKNKPMILESFYDLILFASGLPHPGVIGHVDRRKYVEKIYELKEGIKRTKIKGCGMMELEGIGDVPYKEIKVRIFNEFVVSKIEGYGEKEFTPSCARIFKLSDLEELC